MTVISYYRNLQLISTGVLGGVKASKRHNKPNSQEGGLTIGARRAFISGRVIIGCIFCLQANGPTAGRT